MIKKFINFLKKIFFFGGNSSSSIDKAFIGRNLLSYEELKDLLNLEEIAKEEGLKNSPASSALHPDNFHNELTARYKKLIGDYSNEISTQFSLLESTAANKLKTIAFLGNARSSFNNELDSQLENRLPEITFNNENVKLIKKELKEFRKNNQLTRSADFPASQIFSIFILLLVISIEAILNSIFFAAGLESGVAGGILVAGFISLINVVFSFLIGKFWFKQIFSVYFFKKLIGFVGLTSWISFTLIFNLAVGHIRSAFADGNVYAEATTKGYETFKTAVFENNSIGLDDFQSWMIVIVGLFAAVIALVDGLKSDDQYPGYGHAVRKVLTAEELLHEDVDELKEAAASIHNDTKQNGDKAVENLMSEAIDLRSSHDWVTSLINLEYPRYCEYYASIFKDIIRGYQNLNCEHRSSPAPIYFEDDPDFSWDINNRDLELEQLSKRISDIQSNSSNIADTWAQDRELILQDKTEFLQKLRSYDTIT